MPCRMIEISQTIFSDARRSTGAATSLPRLASASAGVKVFPSYSTVAVSAAAEPRSRKRRR